MYAFNGVASFCRRASFSQLFQKFVQSSQTPTFIEKFLNKFYCSITFENVQFFHYNSIFVAVTPVYTKPLTPKCRLLPSNARSVSE